MKRSELKRTKPISRGTGFGPPKSGMARGSGRQGSAGGMKSRGMKGRAPTADERRVMDAIGSLPCIACMKDGHVNPVISLHHIDGRTALGAHALVLPLCGPHHQQDDSDPMQRPSVHGRKATFTARYGTERELLAECLRAAGLT